MIISQLVLGAPMDDTTTWVTLHKTFGIHFVRSVSNKTRTEVTDSFSGMTRSFILTTSRLKFGGIKYREIEIRPSLRMTGLLVLLIVRTGSLMWLVLNENASTK